MVNDTRNQRPPPEPTPPGSDADGKDGKPKKVVVDDVKHAHTTHWDVDVLPQAELEALYAQQRRKRRWRKALIALAVFGALLAVVSAALLLALIMQ